jgi:FtsZ-interacting cell division protein ZipA
MALMDDPLMNSGALRHPRNRQLLLIVGALLLALLLIAAIWQSSGTRGAKKDLATANERVMEKQREVEDARRSLDEKLAELRALRADADVQATRLGGRVEEQVSGVVDEARLDPATEYYVRDRNGRFVRVTRR